MTSFLFICFGLKNTKLSQALTSGELVLFFKKRNVALCRMPCGSFGGERSERAGRRTASSMASQGCLRASHRRCLTLWRSSCLQWPNHDSKALAALNSIGSAKVLRVYFSLVSRTSFRRFRFEHLRTVAHRDWSASSSWPLAGLRGTCLSMRAWTTT